MMISAYFVHDTGTIKEIEESRGDIDTSVASRKVMEGDKGSLEFQGRRTLALGNPMNHTCQEWLHVEV